jgi:hypothetical protein
MFNVLGKRLEFGLRKQFAEGALTVPTGREVCAVVFPQVFDFGRGMLVVDPSALLTAAAVKSRLTRGVTHSNSFQTSYVSGSSASASGKAKAAGLQYQGVASGQARRIPGSCTIVSQIRIALRCDFQGDVIHF